ncbi:hypothetical protein D3C80_1661690 [compost metagenome]
MLLVGKTRSRINSSGGYRNEWLLLLNERGCDKWCMMNRGTQLTKINGTQFKCDTSLSHLL